MDVQQEKEAIEKKDDKQVEAPKKRDGSKKRETSKKREASKKREGSKNKDSNTNPANEGRRNRKESGKAVPAEKDAKKETSKSRKEVIYVKKSVGTEATEKPTQQNPTEQPAVRSESKKKQLKLQTENPTFDDWNVVPVRSTFLIQ